jgi:hypothetical protein
MILLALVFTILPASAKTLCYGAVSTDGKCGGWRYMDSDFFGSPRTEKVNIDGKTVTAAVLRPAMLKSRFILLAGYFGASPVINKELGIKIKYLYTGIKNPPALKCQVNINAEGRKKGKVTAPLSLPEASPGKWREQFVPLSLFSDVEGKKLLRIHVFPEFTPGISEDAKLYISEISVVSQKNMADFRKDFAVTGKAEAVVPVKKEKRYCAIFPKPYWYTDKKTFYAPRVYKMLHEDGFNVIGVPGTSTYSLPEDLPARVERFINTGEAAQQYPGMTVYPKMTMCWHFPLGGEKFSKMVWFSGYRQHLVCPVDENYWNERILPYCLAYAKASLKVPVFAIMQDWEIYPDNSKGKKFRGVYGVCYCDECWKRFSEKSGIKLPDLPFAERNKYLIDKGLRHKYNEVFYSRLRGLAGKLRSETDKINPKLSYWLIPSMDGTFLTELAQALATKQAPIVISDEGTYGKPSLALSNAEGVKSVVEIVKHDLKYLNTLKVPYIYLAAIMGEQEPEFHGVQAIEMAKLCDGIWLWELSKEEDYKYGRKNLMKYLSQANREIKSGTFKIPGEWLKEKSAENVKIPAGKKGVGLSGMKLPLFKFPDRAYPYELKTLSAAALRDAGMVILQNFNAKLDSESPVVKELREYVKNGGSLFLGHDTGFFMASPFPEIVEGYLLPKERGDIRHILDTALTVEPNRILPSFAGKTYEAGFNDHLVFRPGKEGQVLVKDKYGYPVIVAGTFGKGKVVFSGCYYRKCAADSFERKLTEAIFDWLLK